MHAYLSIAALCQVTEQDRKTVMASLQRLEQRGLIERVGTDGQSNQVAVYRLAATSTKSGTGTSTNIGTGTTTESGTRQPIPKAVPVPETAPVPISPVTGTNFSANQYQFSASPVPKTVHETMNPIKPTNHGGAFDADLFAKFYAAYPRKVGRPSAEKAFAKCKPTPELVTQMLAAISAQAKALNWTRDRLRYVPHPATWLNDERWKDEAQTGTVAQSDRHPQWALDAGFANVEEAGNSRCYAHNAQEFRDGKRIEKELA